MKRILLTTTSLVLAAGVAQADITFSGATGIALIDDNGASVGRQPLQLTQAASAVHSGLQQKRRSRLNSRYFAAEHGTLLRLPQLEQLGTLQRLATLSALALTEVSNRTLL